MKPFQPYLRVLEWYEGSCICCVPSEGFKDKEMAADESLFYFIWRLECSLSLLYSLGGHVPLLKRILPAL